MALTSREYTDQMRINDIFLSFFIVLLIVIVIYHTNSIERVHTRLDAAIAGEVLSSNIKRTIRSYIVTNDEDYLDEYWNLVNIRYGDAKWGEYVIDTPYFNENTMTLHEIYEDVGISEEAHEYFDRAEKIGETAIWKEIEAINWARGFFDTDGKGKEQFDLANPKGFVAFTDKQEPDRQAAIDNMYNQEFMKNERLEHELFTKGYNVEQRTTTNETKSTKYSIIILSILLLMSSIYKLTHSFKSH